MTKDPKKTPSKPAVDPNLSGFKAALERKKAQQKAHNEAAPASDSAKSHQKPRPKQQLRRRP